MTDTQTDDGPGRAAGVTSPPAPGPSSPLAIYKELNAVMGEVGAVKKGGWNDKQSYNFRGIDDVVQAVYPALVKHGVIVTPNVRTYEHGTVEVGTKRTPMGHARVVVEYRFTAVDGSYITCSAAGEAMDSGDKATPKAMSVALRTALLQALMLPTDDPDPDLHSYERTNTNTYKEAKTWLWVVWKRKHGDDLEGLQAAFSQWSGGIPLEQAEESQLRDYAAFETNPRSSSGVGVDVDGPGGPASTGADRESQPSPTGVLAPDDPTRQEGQ